VFRHGGPALAELRALPVYAVGAKTARMATDLGFRVRGHGSGGLAALLPMLVEDGQLHVLRLAGEDHVDLPATRLAIDTRIVYRSRALPMLQPLAEALAGPAVVLLHSARAAQHFGQLVDHARIARAQISLALFAPALAEAAGNGWGEVRVAASPDDRALLDVVATLCQHDAAPRGARMPET
jgi:uroporphyrinogen-III synthase